jgi:hypothetical protein
MVRLEGDRIIEVGERLRERVSWTSARPRCCPGSSTSTHRQGIRPLGGGLAQDDVVAGGALGRPQRPHHVGAGFTTCRDMGPTWPYVDVDLRDAIAQGAISGPHLLVAGNYVSPTGGAGDARQFSLFVHVPRSRTLPTDPTRSPRPDTRTSRTAPTTSRSWLRGRCCLRESRPSSSRTRTKRFGPRSPKRTAGVARWPPTPTVPRASRPRFGPECAPSTTAQCSTPRPSQC